MHSRIFALSTRADAKCAFTEDELFEVAKCEFSLIDYVRVVWEDDSIADDVAWLKGYLFGGNDSDSDRHLVITEEARTDYLRKQYQAVQAVLEQTRSITFEQYVDDANSLSYSIWDIRNAYEDIGGFLIAMLNDDGSIFDVVSLADYVRFFKNSKLTNIVGVYDYHW